jgi:hypothetical protein
MKQIKNKKNQSIIYLDQFASVGLFESKSAEWIKVKELILDCVEKKIAICPISMEHYIETSQKEEKMAITLDNEFYKLSCGFAFKPELFITSQLIISLIRKNNITLKTYLYDEIFSNVLSDKKKLDVFIDLKNQLNIKISEGTQFINDLRKITRNIKTDLKLKEQIISALKSISISEFISRLNDLLRDGYIIIRAISFKSGNIPHWIDQMIFQLNNKHKIRKKEIKLLIYELEKNGFDNIPTLDIRTSLSSIISFYNKKETVNDTIDISRISSGLTISDILFTDSQRKNEIIECGLHDKYKTKIYSGTKGDLEMLILELEKMRFSI